MVWFLGRIPRILQQERDTTFEFGVRPAAGLSFNRSLISKPWAAMVFSLRVLVVQYKCGWGWDE